MQRNFGYKVYLLYHLLKQPLSYRHPPSQSKILGHGFTENNVHKAYQLTCLITKEVKLIMFQYKIIHNILPTQMILFRDSISESDTCPLCNNEKQTLNHLLVSCVTERISFWANFQAWWFGKTLENLNLNQSKILYGIFIHVTTHWHALNYCTSTNNNGSQDNLTPPSLLHLSGNTSDLEYR